ncbi:hypothetical protein BAUCODRAFT_563881 [Baudoinia panamericana UAMH 10762]|uniref:Methyltransferase domain-containing protein n=1 Tax=Baudoinia panamericana (strain UAMH 10762) TaxID=717646 RepID=M2N6W9_BAUPA|nr:uncharacterized protein BAUCODRAFT_563881 [Baudoinia panamericana UAMH 10762]EMC94834.1 hypothetical protein BAUCODRAFT_563881 [Baudoinia panamericana UAMH 10762]
MSAFREANRKAFNDLSATYNAKPWQHKLSQQVSDALQARRDWLGIQWAQSNNKYDRDVKLLDYACGTGAITRALGPYVTTIRGIDISEKMVEEYNKAAQSSGLSTEQARAVVGDLVAETVPSHLIGDDYQDFDIAIIGLGFHHFENPPLAVHRLAERLKPGEGVLVIIDFLPFSHERKVEQQYREQNPGADFPEMSHTIKHDGFTEQDMRRMFGDAGLTDFGFEIEVEPAVMELKSGTRERKIFIAKGRRTGHA